MRPTSEGLMTKRKVSEDRKEEKNNKRHGKKKCGKLVKSIKMY